MPRFAIAAILSIWIHGSARLYAADHVPGQFQHHADVQIKVFAQEPDIVDPVSLTFAANGDCYVIEMRDYPYGVGPDNQPGGTIRLLRDRDGDGRADESKLFASGLSFPTSIMAYRDGVLVLAPPEIRFLRDTDGDDTADINEVVVSGLRRGVTDSNANSLRWGINNMIHVANGGNGGKAKLSGSAESPRSLGNSDFAIDMNRKTIVRTGRTGGGFGLVFDDFGHSFTTHNLDYLQQRIIPSRYIEQSPEMFSFKATENISDHGVSARIFPIVQAVTRVNHPEQAGRFSSSGGMGILGWGPFSDRLANSVFVCDVVCNIVHRDRLREDGPAFRGSRAPEEQNCEFIASRDPSFRPVGLEHGPDGALYLMDMQRDVIEHPDYIPARVREKLDIRAGQDRGRIYRVVPIDGLPSQDRSLADLTSEQLLGMLGSASRWHRTTAHRLLIERNDSNITAAVWDRAFTSESAVARARTLWLAHALNGPVGRFIETAFRDPDPGVRENAILLAERRGTDPMTPVLAALQDKHPRVRFQAALSLDGVSIDGKLELLEAMLKQDWRNKWSRRAVLISVNQDSRQLLMNLWDSKQLHSLPNDSRKLSLLLDVANVAAATEERNQELFVAWLRQLEPGKADPNLAAALLSGLEAGWSRRSVGRLSKQQFASIARRWASGRIEGFASQLVDLISLYEIGFPDSLNDLFVESRKQVTDAESNLESRVSAIEILGRDGSDESFDLLIGLLSAPEPTSIQESAISSIGRMRRSDTGKRLLEIWSAMLPGIRTDVVGLLLSRREHQAALLTALETGKIDFSELNLDLEQRRRLLRWSTDEIGRRAAKLFGDEEYSNRKEIVDHWLQQLPPQGAVAEGREIFAKKCATCHVSEGKGFRVGPDLQALSHRSVEDLLTHILDPNMSINPNYVSCVVQTVDGQVVNGLLAEETTDSITLKQAEGKMQTIERANIEQLKTLKTSLMPEGLEKDLTHPQMRSLIAYLQEN